MPKGQKPFLIIFFAALLLLNCSNFSLAQVNPPKQEVTESFSLTKTLSNLWTSVLDFLTHGPSLQIISPVPLGEVKGVNPQPLPLLEEPSGSYPYQAQGENYKLSYTFGTGGVSTPTKTEEEEESPPPKKSPSETAKSTGEAIGKKVDQTTSEIKGWAKDTNVMTMLIFLGLGVVATLIFLIVKFLFKKLKKGKTIIAAGLLVVVTLAVEAAPIPASAYSTMNSASYQLQDYDLTQGGGKGTSNNYILQEAVGQAFQGSKSGAAYIIYEGIMYYSGILSLVCADATVNIPQVASGTPQSTTSTCTVTTDSATGYLLYASENKDLEHSINSGTYITPANLGSYAAPTPWSTASSLGLGFSLSGSSTQGKWNSGGNYASFVSATPGQINSYASAAAGGATITVTYKLDVNASQDGGTYSNAVSYYATAVL
ncbi:MAG: hypothetical protein Q8N84_03570 [bacterium]|nr:hypothetical protein [bacterium]